LQSSSIYQTAAWGNTHQPDFLNKVIEVETNLAVQNCLKQVLEIEKKMGRVRTEQKWTARTIDIDILFYNEEVINEENLNIPHPYLHERKFVLIPLVEIVPNFVHPLFNMSIFDLLSSCSDELEIKMVLKS
jgi:2-amino-4-hydroxy-6-hydroxymethyldihydropteridine diphosphokinase